MIVVAVILACIALLFFYMATDTSYDKKLSILETNLAEATLKLEAIRSDMKTSSVKAESDLAAIKKDISLNMLEVVKQFAPKDQIESELKRVNDLISQYYSNQVADHVDLTKYKDQVAGLIANIELTGEKVKSLEINNSAVMSKLQELQSEYSKSTDSKLQELQSEHSKATDSKLQELQSELSKATDSKFQELQSEYSKLSKFQELQSEHSKSEYSKLKESQSEYFKELARDIETKLTEARQAQATAFADFISASNSSQKNLESKLVAHIAVIASVADDVAELKKNLGDMSVMKGSVADSIINLNDKLSKYDGFSEQINTLKKNLDTTVGSLADLESSFWDYGDVLETLGPVIAFLKANDKDLTSVTEAFSFAYAVPNFGKMFVFYKLMDAILYMRKLLAELPTNDGVSSAILSAERKMEAIGAPLKLIDYIKNIQSSLASLRGSTSSLNSQLNAKINAQLDNITITNANANAATVAAISELRKNISANGGVLAEAAMKIEALEALATKAAQSGTVTTQLQSTVDYLSNWVGSWTGSTSIAAYVKQLADTVSENKKSQDSLLESLNSLKKHIGDYTFATDESVSSIALDAQNSAARAWGVIGSYDFKSMNNKTIAGYLTSLASQINQLDVSIKALDPSDTNSKLSELAMAIKDINATVEILKGKSVDPTTVSSSLSSLNTDMSRVWKVIGYSPVSETSVREIITNINQSIAEINSKLPQIESNRQGLIQTSNQSIRTNDAISEINEKVKTLTADLTTTRTGISTVMDQVSTIQKAITSSSAGDVNARLVALEDATRPLILDTNMKSMLHRVNQIVADFGSLRRYVLASYAEFDTAYVNAQIAARAYKTVSDSIQAYAFSKEYNAISAFSADMVKLSNILNVTQIPSSDTAAANAKQSVLDYVSNIDYSIRSEPLWNFVQRKFADISSSIDSSQKTMTYVKSLESKLSTIDTLGASVAALSKTVSSFQAATPTVPTMPAITTPIVSADSYANTHVFTSGQIVSGQITGGQGHAIDITSLNSWGFSIPIGTVSNKVSLSEMYALIASYPVSLDYTTNASLYGNCISVSIVENDSKTKSVSVSRSKDAEGLVTMLRSGSSTFARDTTSVYPTWPLLPLGVNYLNAMAVVNSYGHPTSASSSPVMRSDNTRFLTKADLLKILDSLIELSDIYNLTITVAFGMIFPTGYALEPNSVKRTSKINMWSYLVNPNSFQFSDAKIFIDARKSVGTGVPTFATPGLLDVSTYGIKLDGKLDTSGMNTSSRVSYINGGQNTNFCDPNSYVCGITTNYTANYMQAQPVCCSFRKK